MAFNCDEFAVRYARPRSFSTSWIATTSPRDVPVPSNSRIEGTAPLAHPTIPDMTSIAPRRSVICSARWLVTDDDHRPDAVGLEAGVRPLRHRGGHEAPPVHQDLAGA